jgi:hypothetical protein
MDASERVGGAGPAGNHADAWPACKFAVCVGHHGGAAFLAAHRNGDIAIVQAIEHGQVAFAGHAKDMFHTLRHQLIDKYVPA